MRSTPKILLMIESSRGAGRKLIAGIADYANHFGPWQFQWEAVGVQGIFRKIRGQRSSVRLSDVFPTRRLRQRSRAKI